MMPFHVWLSGFCVGLAGGVLVMGLLWSYAERRYPSGQGRQGIDDPPA